MADGGIGSSIDFDQVHNYEPSDHFPNGQRMKTVNPFQMEVFRLREEGLKWTEIAKLLSCGGKGTDRVQQAYWTAKSRLTFNEKWFPGRPTPIADRSLKTGIKDQPFVVGDTVAPAAYWMRKTGLSAAVAKSRAASWPNRLVFALPAKAKFELILWSEKQQSAYKGRWLLAVVQHGRGWTIVEHLHHLRRAGWSETGATVDLLPCDRFETQHSYLVEIEKAK